MASGSAQSAQRAGVEPGHGPRDLSRLERAVRALVAEHAALRGENAELREQLDRANGLIRQRDERILAENQRRQDALKRLDELLRQIEQRAPELAASPTRRP